MIDYSGTIAPDRSPLCRFWAGSAALKCDSPITSEPEAACSPLKQGRLSQRDAPRPHYHNLLSVPSEPTCLRPGLKAVDDCNTKSKCCFFMSSNNTHKKRNQVLLIISLVSVCASGSHKWSWCSLFFWWFCIFRKWALLKILLSWFHSFLRKKSV